MSRMKLPILKKVAICSFSGYVHFPRRFNRAVKEMEKYFGEVVYDGVMDSSIEKRVEHFHMFLKDDTVEAIISLTGGYNSNELLPYLDYDLIKEKKKPIIGFSDTTALQLAILAKTGVGCYYGPAVLFDFGSYDGISPFTIRSLYSALKEIEYFLEFPSEISFSNDFWDEDDNQNPFYEKNIEPTLFYNECGQDMVSGKLIGGNLNTLLALLGTPYIPKSDGAIIFLEDCSTSPSKFNRDLNTLLQAGFFNNIRAILLSKLYTETGNSSIQFEFKKHIENLQNKLKIPVIADLDFGHYLPRNTLRINSQAEINMKSKKIKITNK